MRRLMSLFRRTPEPEVQTRLHAALADLDDAHAADCRAAAGLASRAEEERARLEDRTRQLQERSAERDKRRAARVRAGEVHPVNDRLRGLLEELARAQR